MSQFTCNRIRRSKTSVLCLLIIAMVQCLGVNSVQASSDAKASSFLICKFNGKKISPRPVRTIRIQTDVGDENKCVVIYAKNGSEREVGRGRYMQGCVSILKNIQKNLESSSWTCREVSQATLTTSGSHQ